MGPSQNSKLGQLNLKWLNLTSDYNSFIGSLRCSLHCFWCLASSYVGCRCCWWLFFSQLWHFPLFFLHKQTKPHQYDETTKSWVGVDLWLYFLFDWVCYPARIAAQESPHPKNWRKNSAQNWVRLICIPVVLPRAPISLPMSVTHVLVDKIANLEELTVSRSLVHLMFQQADSNAVVLSFSQLAQQYHKSAASESIPQPLAILHNSLHILLMRASAIATAASYT